jgi:16S rRNA processing protein RimM
VGAVFTPVPGGRPVTLASARYHNGVLLLTFAEVTGRDAAEALRDVLLVADVPDDDEQDAWHVATLVGLRAVTTDGREVGVVAAVEHGPAQDLLVVEQVTGRRAMVPFVTAQVPQVDVDAGYVVLDPPGGLLDDDEDSRGDG